MIIYMSSTQEVIPFISMGTTTDRESMKLRVIRVFNQFYIWFYISQSEPWAK